MRNGRRPWQSIWDGLCLGLEAGFSVPPSCRIIHYACSSGFLEGGDRKGDFLLRFSSAKGGNCKR